MIYKFIDSNEQEITVNSLSSLQALLDSETIKKNTKIKAGLRGKWINADSVEGLTFEEKKVEETPKEEIEDIVDIITRIPEPAPPPKVSKKFKKEKIVEKEKSTNEEVVREEKIADTEFVEKETEDTPSEAPKKEEKFEDSEKKKEFFIKTLIMGEYSLPMTYWIFYFVIGGIMAGAWTTLAELPNTTGATNVILFALFLTTMAYLPICMIGIWRSADKYIVKKQKAKKSVVWGGIAKFVTVLGWIQYAAVWIMFFIGVAEG